MMTISYASRSLDNGQSHHQINRDHWIEQLLQVSGCDLSGAAKVVAVSIALNVDETGRTNLPAETIADLCGMDARAFRRRVHKLVAAGWIGVNRSGGRNPSSYWLMTPTSDMGGYAHV